jgi:hypothetical protein
MRGKRIRDALEVHANGKRAWGWRVRRIKVVLRKQDRREMGPLLAKWDRYLAERGAKK